MKFNATPFILFLVISFFSIGINAQVNTTQKFVQFIFTNLEGNEEAKEIQDYIKTMPDVVTIRVNYNSRKFYLIYNSDASIDRSKIDDWMTHFEKTYKCYREGTHGVDRVFDQTITCEQ